MKKMVIDGITFEWEYGCIKINDTEYDMSDCYVLFAKNTQEKKRVITESESFWTCGHYDVYSFDGEFNSCDPVANKFWRSVMKKQKKKALAYKVFENYLLNKADGDWLDNHCMVNKVSYHMPETKILVEVNDTLDAMMLAELVECKLRSHEKYANKIKIRASFKNGDSCIFRHY